MTRLRREERGGILALSAILIPVFVVLVALVADVGQWYAHKRQLQNRADAAALAAGLEYARNWQACVQSGDLALKASTAREIANAARRYAADPEAADYAPDALPSPLYNANVANQSKLDVVINSDTYTNNTDYTDEPGSPPSADPCKVHTPDANDWVSPSGGHWTDVRVKENDLPSLFGAIGLPLSRNVARARIEVRPSLSGEKFLPLAIPDNVVSKVQVRYYDECRDPGHTSPLAVKDLAPLPTADQTAYAALGGGKLWGLPAVDGDLSIGSSTRGFDLNVPTYDPVDCGTRPYLPVSVEVRLASQPQVDLNQSCSTLLNNLKFADCFTRLSQIRVWKDGNPNAHPLIKDVHLTGGCAARADAYFGPYFGNQDPGARTCNYGATVAVDFGNRATTASNFTVRIGGVDLDPPGGGPNGVWTTSGTPLLASTFMSGGKEAAGNTVRVTVGWRPPSGGPQTYAEDAHRTYVGTTETAGAVDLVRTSRGIFSSGLPGGAYDNEIDGGVVRTVYPTIGIRSVLKPNVYTTLRIEDAQGSQLVQCDPAVSSGQEFTLFRYGCQPWFGRNPFTDGDWWNTTTKECPDSLDWFQVNAPAPYTNSIGNPWRCVIQAPGRSVGQTGDWMAVATENCVEEDIANNKCRTFKTATDADVHCGNYDGTASDPNGWYQQGGDPNDPRVISLFIVPYQSLKGVSGSKAEIPILELASFYVMNWKGQNPSGKEDDPCPDTTFGGTTLTPPDKGTVTGVFVNIVQYESGPVDPTQICTEEQLGQCRVTLVR